jgi:hypothetical protein
MANLSISGSVQGVTINSPPVITFQLVNSDNNTALTGIEQLTVKRSDVKTGAVASPAGTGVTDNVPFYPNLSFAIAKYVPGTNGSPGKWVSYMVSTPTLDANGNRPYGSKVWLVTNGVIGEGPYTNIKHLIVAKQPFKTAEENVAFYAKLKKEKAASP